MARAGEIPLVSVVVLSWMRRDELKRTLVELESAGYPNLEIIVVDNGSTDGSPEMVARSFPGVRLIALGENTGIGGLNQGIRSSSGKYVVLLDDDSHPEPGAMERMVELFEEDRRIGILAFTIINGETGLTDWPREGDLHPDGRAPAFVGCGAGLRRDAALEAGLFDGDYFLYLNELYLTARILDLGYTCRHSPLLRAYHRVAPSHRTSERRIYYTTRNIFKFARVHLPPGRVFSFVLSWFFQGAVYQALRGGPGGLGAFLGGAWAGLAPIRKCRHRLSRSTIEALSPYFEKWYPSPAETLKRALSKGRA